MADIDMAIAERAAPQLGLITRTQFTAMGGSKKMLRTRVNQGVLVPIGAQSLRVGGAPTTWRQQLLAATLDAGPDAVVSHLAAAAYWHLAGVRTGAVEVTVPDGRRPRRVVGLVHLSRALNPVDVDRRGPFPVTTPARTLIDAASRLARPQLEAALDEALRNGLVGHAYLRWRLDQLGAGGRRGVADLRRLLDGPIADRRPESWLERRVLTILRQAGLPAPDVQRPVVTAGGVRRVDFCYPAAGLVIEVDGHRTHSTRRQRQADAQRAAELTALGLEVITFTYEDVTERPDYVVETIAGRLGLR